MASTYTNIGIEKQATGENANTWGTKTNTNFDIIDERLSEIYEISSTSATQTISAPTDATAGQNTRSATLKYTGAASADMVVTLPTDVKITYNVLNWGTGDTGVGTGYDITFKVGSGTNTATKTTVVAIIAKETCLAPLNAATRGVSPNSILLTIFSSITIASSTTIPIAKTKAINVKRLIEKSNM